MKSSYAAFRFKLTSLIATSLIVILIMFMNLNIVYSQSNSLAGMQKTENIIPIVFKTSQNSSNSFNTSTVIQFDIPEFLSGELVTLSAFEISGKVPNLIVNEPLNAGSYKYVFTAPDLSSGMYIYELRSGDYVQTGKLAVVD